MPICILVLRFSESYDDFARWESMMRLTFPLLILAIVPYTAHAHFHMLLIDKPSVKAGETLTITYKFGHPFESELFDAQKPVLAKVYAPDRTSTDLLPTLEPVNVAAGDKKKIAGYRCPFEPKERGDYSIIFESPPIWFEDKECFFQDAVRVNLHVQAEKGWMMRHQDGTPFAFVPMTRPYGLRPGTVFQARVKEGLHRVELEKYNAKAPTEMPPEESITLSLMTDERGVATCTLPEPGWWVLTAEQQIQPMTVPPTIKRDGKEYPLYRRASLWVFVDELPAKKGAK